MKSVVGIFRSADEAERAAERLRRNTTPEEEIKLLTPDMSQEVVETRVPVEDAETQGIGRAIGGVVVGAIALAGASHLGAYVWGKYASHPLVGPLVFIGIVLAGVAGIWIGVKAVGYAEDAGKGIPHDDLFLYEDALKQKRSIVVALTETDEHAEQARNTLNEMGAESLDTARERWWIGLRSAETEHYKEYEDEVQYRHGFEAALNPDFSGRTYEEAANLLVSRYGDEAKKKDFRNGFERGQAYYMRQIHPRRVA